MIYKAIYTPITKSKNATVLAMIKELSEPVEVLRTSDETGNALVRDAKGRTFYCHLKSLVKVGQ